MGPGVLYSRGGSYAIFASQQRSIVLEVGELLCALLRAGDPEWLLLIVVKVAGVAGALALGDERGLDLEFKDLLRL